MATIGLYDIDLWHRGKSVPNLELMKIFNYYKQQNQIVKMMRPGEDEGRYNSICYFKDNPRVQIPRSLILNGDKKTTYGYGFYNAYTGLSPEITAAPPSYEPYDVVSYKLKVPKSNYDELKKSSLIRIESNDFTDYKKDKRKVFFADHNFFYQKNAYEHLIDLKQHQFYFLHSLRIKDEETYYKFERFFSLISNYIVIDFRYSSDFFFDVFTNPQVIFPHEKRENETKLNYYLRNAKVILFYKSRGVRLKFPFMPTPIDDIDNLLIKWGSNPSNESFEKLYPIPVGIPSELRVLLKQDPKKIGSSQLDFYKNL